MILLEQVPTLDGDLSKVEQSPLFSSNASILVAAIALIVVIGIILLIYMTIARQRNKSAGETIFISGKDTAKYNRILLLYNTLDNLPPTRKYLNRLRREFEMIAPGDGRFAKEKATWITLLTWGGGLLAGILVLLLKPTLYMLIIVLFTVYIISQEAVNIIVSKNELMLMEQFLKFLSRFRYHYLITNAVDEAISDAMAEVPHLMQLHARQLLIVLQSEADKIDEALLIYKNAVSNLFLKQFLAICVTTMQNGDLKVDGTSLCLTNVKDLRVDIEIEIRKRKDISASFSGSSLVICLPVYTLQFISNWGVSSISSLQGFYYGTLGSLAMLACFVITVAVYSYVNQLKETHHQRPSDHYVLKTVCRWKIVERFTKNYWNKNYGNKLRVDKILRRTGSNLKPEHFLVRSLLVGFAAFVASCVIFVLSNVSVKDFTDTDFTEIASEATSGTEEQTVIMMFLTKYYYDYFKNEDLLLLYNETNGTNITQYTEEFETWFNQLLQDKFEEGGALLTEEDALPLLQQYNQVNSASTMLYTSLFGTTGVPEYNEADLENKKAFKQMYDMIELAADEDPLYNTIGMYEIVQKHVLNKYKRYNGTYFHWYFFALAIIAGVIAYNVPMFLLRVREEDLQITMQNEVLQYHSIILLLIYFENVNALTILDWMNIFAEIFEASISRCITEFTMDERKALQKLYDDEPFEEFQRIVENLMMVDDVGVLQAFNELSATRKSNQETRSQDNKNVIASRASRAEILQMIPLAAVAGGYLCIPMIVEALSMMSNIVNEISAM